MTTLFVSELFASIQGESTRMGLPCVFLRLAGCNLDCHWCDSVYAAKGEGAPMTIEEILAQTRNFGIGLVEVTGGEPLLQEGTEELLTALCDARYAVLVETNGSLDLSPFDPRVSYIIDYKLNGSGAGGTFCASNFDLLRPVDEVKFVVADRADFDEAVGVVKERDLLNRSPVLFSAAFNRLDPKELATWLVECRLPVRLNLQAHKYIWGPDVRGV